MRLKQLLHALEALNLSFSEMQTKETESFFFHLVQQEALREEIASEKAHVGNPRRATRKPIQAIFSPETLCRFAINPYLCTRFCERANHFGA